MSQQQQPQQQGSSSNTTPPPVINYGQDEIPHLRSQNDQLWKIIEKQRVMIQNLQKDNVRLSAERDGLLDQINLLEKEVTRKQRVASLLISPQALREIAEADDALGSATSSTTSTTTPTPSSEHAPSPFEQVPPPLVQPQQPSFLNTNLTPVTTTIPPNTMPMPPPRSPYRPLKQDKSESDFFKQMSSAVDTQQQQQAIEPMNDFLLSMQQQQQDSMNGRSSPGSPAPGPVRQQQRKDSAPLPSPSTRTHSPFIVPSPSKSSSSLEITRTKRQQNRDSMMPPTRAALDHDPTMRAASPPVPSFTRPNTAQSAYKKRESTLFSNSSTRTADSYHDGANEEENYPHIQQQAFMGNGNMANVCIKVVGSNIKPNDKGKEVISFILSVGSLNEEDRDAKFEERWRVEKLYSDFLSLDSKLKAQRNRTISGRIGKLPDKALFSNNAPSKVDQRKVALENYLQHVISLPLEDASDLCEFLSTNVIDQKVYQTTGQKEGYLTKRGKNFGGWKTRYFVLNESVLEYYESKEGTQLGSIRLTNAQIGRQMPGTSPATEEYNSVYRHAFLIVEQKRLGSTHYVRHILCANSDDDRDDWVHALLQNIQVEDDQVAAMGKSSSSSTSGSSQKKNSSSSSSGKKEDKPRKLSKGEIRAISAAPISHLKLDHVGNADMEKLTSVPTITTPLEDSSNQQIGMAVSSSNNNKYSRPTPSISSDSTDSIPISSSLPSSHPSGSQTWSSYNDHVVRTSFDQQQQNRGLHAPRPAIVRRSSMGNLTTESTNQEELLHPHQYRRAISPTISSSTTMIDNSSTNDLSIVVSEPGTTTTTAVEPASNNEKKTRNKAHRMTFWGKKMLFNNSNSNELNEAGGTPPKPSQSSSATTNNSRDTTDNSTMSRSTTTSSTTSNSGGLRGFLSRSSHEQSDRSNKKSKDDNDVPNLPQKPSKQVFGVSLEEAVRISRVSEGYELPAVVYRCIEYLDAMDAVLEEGLYRLSGSNSTMKALKEKFNQEGDVNLLAAKDDYDVHVVAGLLKMWLRELPTSVLTREHRMDFLHVIDLLDRKDRVNELGRLVSVLPLSNYTLLRALTAHLIRVVQHSDINKMTMRNVSIVFSPTLGIPATIFNLFMSEFEYIFWTTEDGDAAPRMIEDEVQVVVIAEESSSTVEEQGRSSSVESEVGTAPINNGLSRKTTLRLREEHGRSNRNSVNYMDGAPNAIVDLEKNMDGPPVLDEDDDEDVDDLTLSTNESQYSQQQQQQQQQQQHLFVQS